MGGESADSTFIVTAAGDKVTFKIWKIAKSGNEIDLQMHIKVDTKIQTGIHYVLQTSPTQIVCCNDSNVLKFYDFVDKVALRDKEDNEKQIEMFSGLVAEAFREADEDNSGFLDIEEVKPMMTSLISRFGGDVRKGQESAMLDKMFAWLDTDGSGRVSFHEFKVQMMRAFIKRTLPDELMQ